MSGRPRVLVVDDDVAVASLHRHFVESHGRFTVVGTAHTGAEALRLAEETEPDLVLLDVFLPDMGGLEVLQRLRSSEGGGGDIIAITAARELETVRRAMAGGVLHYLVKPFSARVLRERLDDYLRHRDEIRRSEESRADLDQAQVDRLLSTVRRGPTVTRLPKGLSVSTMEAVRDALVRSDGSASAQEIGDEVGVSRVSARRYLEHLVDQGAAKVVPLYGGPGRPANRYHWLR